MTELAFLQSWRRAIGLIGRGILNSQLFLQQVQEELSKRIRTQSFSVVCLVIFDQRVVDEKIGDLDEGRSFDAVLKDSLEQKQGLKRSVGGRIIHAPKPTSPVIEGAVASREKVDGRQGLHLRR